MPAVDRWPPPSSVLDEPAALGPDRTPPVDWCPSSRLVLSDRLDGIVRFMCDCLRILQRKGGHNIVQYDQFKRHHNWLYYHDLYYFRNMEHMGRSYHYIYQH